MAKDGKNHLIRFREPMESRAQARIAQLGLTIQEYVRKLVAADLEKFGWQETIQAPKPEKTPGISGAPRKDPLVKQAQERYQFAMSRYTGILTANPHLGNPGSIGFTDREHLQELYNTQQWQAILDFCADNPWNKILESR